MATIDDVLRSPAEVALPPLVRWLKGRLAAGDQVTVEVFQPASALGSSAAELVLHRVEGGTGQEPKPVPWDDDLNGALVALGVRAIDLKNEGGRFALGLRAALRTVERRYGDGYLNAVLVDLIDESDLGRGGEVAQVRKFVHASSPEKGSRTYSDCRDQIASAIGSKAVELREKLGYSEDELRAIMSAALARYLDERFSVSRRRSLGWL